MFGIVQKDNSFSNVTISSTSSTGNLSSPAVIQPISPGYPSTPTGPYSVMTHILDNTNDPVNYNLTVDSTNSVLGDTVTYIFKALVPFGPNAATVNLPINVFLLYTQTEIVVSDYLQYNLTLLYNGTLYLNTFESC